MITKTTTKISSLVSKPWSQAFWMGLMAYFGHTKFGCVMELGNAACWCRCTQQHPAKEYCPNSVWYSWQWKGQLKICGMAILDFYHFPIWNMDLVCVRVSKWQFVTPYALPIDEVQCIRWLPEFKCECNNSHFNIDWSWVHYTLIHQRFWPYHSRLSRISLRSLILELNSQ